MEAVQDPINSIFELQLKCYFSVVNDNKVLVNRKGPHFTNTIHDGDLYNAGAYAVCTQEIPTFETLTFQGRVVFCIFE